MTQLIPTRFKNTINITSKASFLLVLLFALFSKTNLNAQCIGPYARFESFAAPGTNVLTATASPNFTTLSTTSVAFGSSVINARSGTVFCQTLTNGGWLMTPTITNPKTFSFYIKTSTVNAYSPTSFIVEYATSLDSYATFTNINTVSGVVLPTSATSTYNLVSVTLPNLGADVKFRIKDVNTRAANAAAAAPPTTFFGQLHIDDIFWDTYNSTVNNVIVPVRNGNGTLIQNCAGGQVTVGTSDTYNFYDNGGASDKCSINQLNTVTFTPTIVGYTAGDRIRIQFISYAGAITDKIEVWDDNGTALNATTNLLTHTAITLPPVLTYMSSISADGSITIRFTSDATTNVTGFNIKVDCVRCPTPTGLATTVVGASNASLTWDTTSAANYDVYYSTSNTPPTGAVTPQGLNLTTNSYSITGLAPGSYYVWVRSKCSSSPDSYSPWSPSLNFVIASCSFALSNSPSTVIQNLCKNTPDTTALTASASGGTVSTYQWYSNASATTIGGTAVGTNSSSYAPLTTIIGTLYYYCVITSTLGCTITTAISGAVNVMAPTTPNFTQVEAVCTGVTIAALPTTSTNGVTGTWSPAINNTETTTYTFTPNAGQCESTTTMTITVNPLTAPTFTPIGSVCIGIPLAPLPTTSIDSITGTWSPAINSNATTTYTFTPDAGQCATATTQTIIVSTPLESSPISFLPLPVNIGSQIWATTNLEVTTYCDGTPIPQVTDPVAWANLTTGAWCYYNNDPAKGAVYGKLYNWYAVAGIHDELSKTDSTKRKKLAPIGWHVPTDNEWSTLTTSLGGENTAGSAMKEIGFNHWSTNNTDATNTSNFAGLPGGCRFFGSSTTLGNYGFWWSFSDAFPKLGGSMSLSHSLGSINKTINDKTLGFSVRCVKD